MIELVEGYTHSNRVAAESSPEGISCTFTSSCPCPPGECSPESQYWPGHKVSFADITVLLGRDPRQTDDGTCLANAVATTYLNVASKEYDDRTRIGYMYSGLNMKSTVQVIRYFIHLLPSHSRLYRRRSLQVNTKY